jgi:MYXO-CTERM domain-containing protein
MNSSDTQLTTGVDGDVSILRLVGYVAVLITLGAVLSVTAAGAPAQADTDEPLTDAIVVDLDAEGDAVVTVTIPFDLTVTDQATEFEAFAENESKQAAQLDQYESRLSNIAAEMESQTGREMSVTNPSLATETRDGGDLGVVELTATWEGLAATDGDRLVLGPPFDSGFDADRTVAVRPPDQHRVVSTTPTPDSEGERLSWNGGDSLDGFEVVVAPQGEENTDDTSGDDGSDDSADDTSGDDGNTDGSDDSADDTSGDDGSDGSDDSADDTSGDDGSGPGFGILVVLLGAAGLGAWARRR